MSRINLQKSIESLIPKPLVIIDRQVDQLSSLVKDIQSRGNIVILDTEHDGIAQITQALSQYQYFSSLHLVSHGSPGSLHLGNTKLNLGNISKYSQDLQSWAKFLTGKDILVYGCQVAKKQGQIFLEQLSQLTGGNIAASREKIGLTEFGRYWNLEFQVGKRFIQDSIFSPSLQASYTGAFVDYDETVDGDISNDPNNPLALTLEAGTNSISATTGGGIEDQEYVTVIIPEGFQLDTLILDSFSTPGDPGFIGVQQNDVFTEPLDNSADVGNFLGYLTFGSGVGTNILDNIGNASGAIGFNGALPSGVYTFALQQLTPSGSSYTLEFNISEVAVEPEPPTEPPTEQPTGDPVVSFEAIPNTISEEGSAEERLLRLEFNVMGEIPEGGLVVLFENLFGITDQMDGESDQGAFNNLGLVPPFDTENNIIGVRLDANEASMELPIANDLIEEETTFDFRVLEGEGYTVDPNQNATLFTINDDNGGPGVGPTIALSVSESNLAEGDPLTINFDVVEGDIDGSVDVLVQSTVGAALGQFELSDLSSLQLSGVTNLRPGDTRGESFIATLTESNASITLNVFDDILAEEPIELPFTLVNGELYEVDPNAGNITLTISDDIDIVGPTVGIALDKSDAVEGETVTLTLTTEGEIPAEGLPVLINDVTSAGSGARSLTEFDVVNVEFTGISEFPSPAEGDSGFFVNITDPTATITLPVLDDSSDEDEALESFTYEVIDGEAYEVDADASSVTLNISDADGTEPTPTPGDAAVVSFAITPDVLAEDADNLEMTFTWTVEGEIPEVEFDADGNYLSGGLSILADGTVIAPFFEEITGGPILDGITVGSFFDPEQPTLIEFILLENTATGIFNIFNDIIEEADQDYTFTLLNDDNGVLGSNYAINPDAASVTVTLVDGDSANPGGGPTVSLFVTEDELEEGDEFTINFEVDGEIPEGGLTVYVDGPALSLSEFNIFGDDGIDPATDLVGITGFPEQDGDAGGFFATLTENQASITLSVFDDGPTEGTEVLSFELVDGEQYEVTSIVNYEFSWTGQIAEFMVEGEFSYDAAQSYEAGIVREEDLLSFDVSFFDPDGNLLRTYTDNQDLSRYPTFNFAFDTQTQEILQDGTWDVDDDINPERNGFMFGEGNPDLRGMEGAQSGLAFWTRPSDDKLPHLHVDDWDDELGFPIGYSSHEDVSFPTLTVADLIDNGKVGETYLESVQDSLDELGKPVVVSVSKNGSEGKVELTIDDSFMPVFGTVEGDVVEVEGSNQLIFAGAEGDLVDASVGSGSGNRLYLGGGDDIAILGMSDKIVGGAGDDKFFAMSGGDNVITGGAGADQFWIATAETPDAANIITDFTSGEDVLGIAGLGIGFDDLSITQQDDNTLIATNNSELAILQGVGADMLNADSFAFV